MRVSPDTCANFIRHAAKTIRIRASVPFGGNLDILHALVERSADRGHLQSALGRGVVLPNVQADIRASQTSEPFGGKRSVRNRLVLDWIVEHLSVGATRVSSSRPRSERPEPRGGDQGGSASDASLSHSARASRRDRLGDVSLRVARRLRKDFVEDGSQLPEEKETRTNRSSQAHRGIQIKNRCGTPT